MITTRENPFLVVCNIVHHTILVIYWQTGDPFTAAGTLLFSFTYLWAGINAYTGVEDQRSLGWYCIFVTLVTLPNGYFAWAGGDVGLALLWWIWALLGLELTEYTQPIAW